MDGRVKLFHSVEIQQDQGFRAVQEDAWIQLIKIFSEDDPTDYLGFYLIIVLPAWQWGRFADYGNSECWAQTTIEISNIHWEDRWNRSIIYRMGLFVRKDEPTYRINSRFYDGTDIH
jgi:hypothetical protein